MPKFRLLKIALFVFFFSFLTFFYINLHQTLKTQPAKAAGDFHYVRAGATGLNNGSDWTNAWTNLPATLARGDTYYIADGAYSSYTFDDAVSGTQYITIKKAIESDHGTDAGWNSSYGDGQAVFDASIRFYTSFWEFNGQVGGGQGSWDSGYGFKITTQSDVNGTKLASVYNNSSNISIRHTDMVFEGDIGGTTAWDHDAFYALGGSDILLSYCSFKHSGRVHLLTQDINRLTLEHSYLYRNRECALQHSAPWADSGSDNIVIKNNFFRENMGTAWLDILSRGSFAVSDNWEIYGNIFLGGGREYNVTNGTIVVINGQEANNWKIYNNTFANIDGAYGVTGIAFANGVTTSGGHQIYNNIWYNCENSSYSFASGDTTSVYDYDLFIGGSHGAETHEQVMAGNPFTDISSLDFRLTSATQTGFSLSSPYNLDLSGNARGSDGVWDRGAYEYVSVSAADVIPPSAPVGVAVN
ncbi:MAG: hypothetical protein PHR36_00850 [Patescibacteria group bacterium]|nr:hypothetical protein [Patescibacteria group bacterium]